MDALRWRGDAGGTEPAPGNGERTRESIRDWMVHRLAGSQAVWDSIATTDILGAPGAVVDCDAGVSGGREIRSEDLDD